MTVVTAADTIRWLHEDGLRRLAGFGKDTGDRFAAYAVAITDGTISMYLPGGEEISSTGADELPAPADGVGRLVVAGITAGELVLVLDLAAILNFGIVADDSTRVVRSWVVQLLLNPRITLSTNDSTLDTGISARYRKRFIPGGGATLLTVDDGAPPVTTLTVNPSAPADHIEVGDDGSGALHLGTRRWSLRQAMIIDDAAWEALCATVGESTDTDDSDSADADDPDSGDDAPPGADNASPGATPPDDDEPLVDDAPPGGPARASVGQATFSPGLPPVVILPASNKEY